ncbi:hypothetical protein [Streptomyces sp. A1499]|uniref:hypothetical protein n=1 Tax=Streptomyces sp. A1499 TaxID=2563104 RepID=UPI001F0DA669|nr:hypothetical protein [Streptomyces sp. A1499]
MLPLITQGKTYAQMAWLVGRSPAVVRHDFRNLTDVLQATTRPHLVTRLLEYRLVTVGEVRTWLS